MLRVSPRLFFGAGGTQGGVKRATAAKITYNSWYLKEATRSCLNTIHHPLVTEYLIRLDDKRRRIETWQEESVSSSTLAPLTNVVDGSALDIVSWNTRYRDELDIASQMTELLVKLDENVLLESELADKDATPDNAELLTMVKEDINEGLEEIRNLDSAVSSVMERRLGSEDVVGSSSRVWNVCVAGKAGGEEADLFAGELGEMFKSYATEFLGLRVEGADDSDDNSEGQGAGGGHRFRLSGEGVYRYFHHEIGVHKVQRVPVTDAAGKMQTSTAVFTMMPVLDPVAVNVHESDCKIDYVRGSGPGGQGMQSSSNCVVLTHIPSGISVKCHQSRSALGNKELALQTVAQKILSQKVKDQNSSLYEAWKNQWSSGERSDKMRTYNYPQNRITDHRLGKDFPLSTFMDRGCGLKELHEALNSINDGQELVNVLLKHIQGDFGSVV